MTVLRWFGVLGIVGFLCGFIGPMVLAPDANQGPMLGIFITGPTGALLGAVLGVAAGLAKLSPQSQSRALVTAAIGVAAITLYFCVPPARLKATVVDAELRSCVAAETLRAGTVDRLSELAAARPVPEHVQWNEMFDQELAAKPGIVIDVHVFRDARVYEKQARWNKGAMFATSWHDDGKDERYFGVEQDSDCAKFPAGSRSILMVTGITGTWRPYGIAEMLGLRTAAPLPEDYAGLLDAQGVR
jgi:uncharacterized membrane protein YeaQ/YmgE (transglycosylase-associated protein family)